MSMLDPVSIMLSGQSDFSQRKYYVGNNTFQTAISINANPTAITATEGCLSIYNSASATGSSNRNAIVVPMYIKLFCTAATDGTDMSFKFSTDVANRYSTGGTALTMYSTFAHSDTVNNARPTSVSTIHFGDLTLAAATSEAQVGDVQIRPASSATGTVIGDEYLITFGGYQMTSAGTITAAASKQISKVLPPVFLGPGASLIAQPFSTGATNVSSFYVECGVLELFHNPTNS